MKLIALHYGKRYAPNTRERVRRQTIHQFEDAGLVVKNPDRIRAINDRNNVYQIESSTLELLKTFKTDDWAPALAVYLSSRETLKVRYANERRMKFVPVTLPGGKPVHLSPGDHNLLIKEIVEKFCGYHTPGGEILYIGDTGSKYVVWEEQSLLRLGIRVDRHGKMPDVVVHYKARDWLILVEAVTSHGPVDAKRHEELRTLFSESTIGLVFVTAFLDRRAMTKYVGEISWETEVWVADAPTHLIHFNGERFLGPYAPASE